MNLHEAIERGRAFAADRGIQLGERVCGFPFGTRNDPYWELFFEIPDGPDDWAWVVWVYSKGTDMEERPFQWPNNYTPIVEWREPQRPTWIQDRLFLVGCAVTSFLIIAGLVVIALLLFP